MPHFSPLGGCSHSLKMYLFARKAIDDDSKAVDGHAEMPLMRTVKSEALWRQCRPQPSTASSIHTRYPHTSKLLRKLVRSADVTNLANLQSFGIVWFQPLEQKRNFEQQKWQEP